mgnify:CR=1 FL=1
MLAALAIEGHQDRDAARRAFDAGMAALGPLLPATAGDLPDARPRGAEIREALQRARAGVDASMLRFKRAAIGRSAVSSGLATA